MWCEMYGNGARTDYFEPLKKDNACFAEVCSVDVAADIVNEEKQYVYKK